MNVVETKVNGLVLEQKTQQNIVILREVEGERILPIWIGGGEAQAIRRILSEEPFPRPLTHDLLALVVEGLKAKITRVVIGDLKENTFYATVIIERESEVLSIDARPSDSIALALRTGAQIFASEEILDEAGVAIPEEPEDNETEVEKFREFLDTISPEDFGRAT